MAMSEANEDSDATEGSATYVVERVLAERNVGNRMFYLVKWQDYDFRECTWEPTENFDDPATLAAWRERRSLERVGRARPANVAEIERQMKEFQDEEIIRRRERRERPSDSIVAKRARSESEHEDSPAKKRRLVRGRKRRHMATSISGSDRSASSSSAASLARLDGTKSDRDSRAAITTREPNEENEDVVLDSVIDGSTRAAFSQLPTPDQKEVVLTVEHMAPAPSAVMATDDQNLQLSQTNSIISDGSLFGDPQESTVNTKVVEADKSTGSQPNIEASDRSSLPKANTHENRVEAGPPSVKVANRIKTDLVHGRPRPAISMVASPVEKRLRKKPADGSRPHETKWPIVHQWHYNQRLLQDNRKPDENQLTLVDPKTGAIVQEPRSASSLLKGTNQTTDEAISLANEERRHLEDRKSPTQSLAPIAAETILSFEQLTCRRWKKGRCNNDSDCRFAHADTGRMGPKKPATCRFWAKEGRCEWSDELCEAHHAFKDQDGSFSLMRRGRDDFFESCALGSKQTFFQDRLQGYGPAAIDLASTYGFPLSNKRTTCRYWFRGACRNGSACALAHEACAFITIKTRKTCRFWLNNENCAHGEDACEFWHCELDSNGLPARFRYPMTCKAWSEGNCHNTDESCDRYHTFWEPPGTGSRKPAALDLSMDEAAYGSPENLFEPPAMMLDLQVTGIKSAKLQLSFVPSEAAQLRSAALDLNVSKALILAHECLADDFIAAFTPDTAPGARYYGFLSAVENPGVDEVISTLTSYLATTPIGMVGCLGNRIFVIHSSEDLGWMSFHNSVSQSRQQTLRLLAFDISLLPTEMKSAICESSVVEEPANTVGLTDRLVNLDVEAMFSDPSEGKVKRHVFLIFPTSMVSEMTLLRRHLERFKVVVYDTITDGDWRIFFQNSFVNNHCEGGYVFWHPQLWNYWEMPKMHTVLHRDAFRHKQLDNPDTECDGVAGKLNWKTIFPCGSATLLTDELIVNEPLEAIKVVKRVEQRIAASNDCERHCLFARPGLIAFIDELREKALQERHDAAAEKFTSLIRELLRITDDLSARGAKRGSLLEEPHSRILGGHAAMYDKDPRQALDRLVGYYCMWTMSQVYSCRKFYAVFSAHSEVAKSASPDEEIGTYTPKTPWTPQTPGHGQGPRANEGSAPSASDIRLQRWQEKFKHIWFLTPDKYPSQRKRQSW